MIVASQWNISSSLLGPALQLVGGSFCKSYARRSFASRVRRQCARVLVSPHTFLHHSLSPLNPIPPSSLPSSSSSSTSSSIDRSRRSRSPSSPSRARRHRASSFEFIPHKFSFAFHRDRLYRPSFASTPRSIVRHRSIDRHRARVDVASHRIASHRIAARALASRSLRRDRARTKSSLMIRLLAIAFADARARTRARTDVWTSRGRRRARVAHRRSTTVVDD